MKIVIISCCLLLVTLSGLKIGNFFTSGQAYISTPDTNDGCVPYCNNKQLYIGSPMQMDPNFSCVGLWKMNCNATNWLISSTCLGTFNFVINPNLKVRITCDGYSNFITQQNTMEHCGGSILVEYFASKDSIFPNYAGTNITCNGTYTIDSGLASPTPIPAPTPTLRKVFWDTAGDQGAIDDLPPPGTTCTYMCGNEEYDGKVCQGDYEMSCDTDEQETTKYSCRGIFVGNWNNRACIGIQKLVKTAAGYFSSLSCTKSSLIEMESGIVCEGEYSNKNVISYEKSNIFA